MTRRDSELTDFHKYPLWIRVLLIAGGSISVGLGVLGIFLPILPTTPFLLLAAFCYARSSEKFYIWLLTNRWFGEYIRNYREKRGVPLKVKIYTLLLLWITILSSAYFFVPVIWGKILLLMIAIGVSWHLIYIKTLEIEAKE
ncbi:MAG: YbaN family protein [Candidatus Cloacimonadales bacterium]